MSNEYRYIVRIAGTDVDGSKRLIHGLTKIKGVGVNLASAMVRALDMRADARIGDLSDSDVEKIEDIIADPVKHGIPEWMLNRRKDRATGQSFHLTRSDLDLKTKEDIDFMKEIGSWRGMRHALGLKVRGQRTRTTGRKGRAVGVKKKALMAAAAKQTSS
ncbi:MAG: 30S ribosomal protein S13 [Candidatus Bathyarchaeia archaeon]